MMVTTLKVSVVPNATSISTSDWPVSKLLDVIRTGGKKLRPQIEQIRNRYAAELAFAKANAAAGQNVDPIQQAKLAVSELKKQLPGTTWSGAFTERANDKLKQHSGLLCADLDGLGDKLPEVRDKLTKSPYAWSVFLSPSGEGLKAVFKVPADAAKHAGSFRAVQKHVHDLTGVGVDERCKDVARLCFLSYDPEIYVNEDAAEIEPLPEPEKPKPIAVNGELPPDMPLRERIATELLGALTWSAEKGGYFCRCPGESCHTNGTGDKHCIIYLDGGPTIKCQPSGNAPKISDHDEAELARLAALPVLVYERERKEAAEKLGCRESTLNDLVKARRPRSDNASRLQGNAVVLQGIEPWPEPVNGAQVLDGIAKTFESYLVLPDGAADAVGLWIGHSHCFDVFSCSPRLNVSSPERECAKTLTRDVVAEFVPRPIKTENLTTAVLFRLVDSQMAVILADEYDRWLNRNEELVGLLNAGHRQGGMVLRCEGDNNEVRGFRAYAPAFLSGIGPLTGTLHDRSIVVRMTRAKLEEIKARKRFDSRHTEREQELCRKLVRWITDNRENIAACEPKLPEGVFNRLADNWRPLFAIAEVIGGDWPERCKIAFSKLTIRANGDTESLRVMLLGDIRDVFTEDVIFSHDLTEILNGLKDRPWPEANRGKPISERWLALKLGAFGIKPKNVRLGDKQAKGYERADFEDAFARFLPDPRITSVHPSHTEGKSDFHNRPKDESGTLVKTACTEGMGRLDTCETGICS